MSTSDTPIEGVLLDEGTGIAFRELCVICDIGEDELILLVREGLLMPTGAAPEQWRFSGIEVGRARRALRLQRDLDLNLAGAVLAVELLEELEHLRRRLRLLETQAPAD